MQVVHPAGVVETKLLLEQGGDFHITINGDEASTKTDQQGANGMDHLF